MKTAAYTLEEVRVILNEVALSFGLPDNHESNEVWFALDSLELIEFLMVLEDRFMASTGEDITIDQNYVHEKAQDTGKMDYEGFVAFITKTVNEQIGF